jgi:hypothetical protein
MRVQVNIQPLTSNSSRCLPRLKSTALRGRGAGFTGRGIPSRRRNGAGNRGVQLASCHKRRMLQISNVIRMCRPLAIWGRATDSVELLLAKCRGWVMQHLTTVQVLAALQALGKH